MERKFFIKYPLAARINSVQRNTYRFGGAGENQKRRIFSIPPGSLAIFPELSRSLGTFANLVVLPEFLFDTSMVV